MKPEKGKPKREGRARRTRERRTPDEARALILAAAERVFAHHLPDVVGLKEVAAEAGVSHALVTHYFGTYAKLVEATLEVHGQRLREAVLGGLFEGLQRDSSPQALLANYRKAVTEVAQNPATLRLAVWAMLSGRMDRDDFIAHRMQGLRRVADALEAKSGLPRGDLEFGLIASFAITVVWTLGGRSLSGALGRTASRAADADFEARTARMIDAFLSTGAPTGPARRREIP